MDGNWESGGIFSGVMGVFDWFFLSLSHCFLRPTTKHFGQFDQTIFTTERKCCIYSELRPDSDLVDGGMLGCFLVWLIYLIDSVYSQLPFHVLPRLLSPKSVWRFPL